MTHFTNAQLNKMGQRYRAMFVNSLTGFKSANLVGTCNTEENCNLSIVSSVFHIGASPALMGMIIRPATVRRDTLNNLLETGFYTINHVHSGIVEQAHQTSARYDEAVSEFDAVGLTEQYLHNFPAPYIKESRLKIGLALRERQTLHINKTELIIGEIQDVHLDDSVIADDGYIDIGKLDSVSVSGLDSYHSSKKLCRLSYAKPGQKAHKL